MRQDNEFFWWRLFPRCGWAAGVGTVRGGRGLLAARGRARGGSARVGGVGAGSLIGKGNERRLPADQAAPAVARGHGAARPSSPGELEAASRQLDRLVPSGGSARPPWAARCFLLPEMYGPCPWLASCAARTTCGDRAEVGRQRAGTGDVAHA